MNEYEEIWETLKEIAGSQNQQAKMLLRHSEILVEHDRRMAGHDERMEQVGRHLEVLANIPDDLIRNRADRKRR